MKRTLLLVGVVALTGCENTDIGTDCGDEFVIPNEGTASSEGDVMHSEGSEIVEYNAAFPCESSVCIATLGRGGYCSKDCRSDAACPSAFECRVVMDIGPFEGQRYCAWKECKFSEDCGDKDKYVCTKVEELSLGKVVSLCGLRH